MVAKVLIVHVDLRFCGLVILALYFLSNTLAAIFGLFLMSQPLFLGRY